MTKLLNIYMLLSVINNLNYNESLKIYKNKGESNESIRKIRRNRRFKGSVAI